MFICKKFVYYNSKYRFIVYDCQIVLKFVSKFERDKIVLELYKYNFISSLFIKAC